MVGAGISGLLAARFLQDHGVEVVVLEKSLGFGGRLATRRIEDATFDHGAQYFTVRDQVFGDYVNRWRSAGIVHQWATAEKDNVHKSPWLCGGQGMTSIAKHLASNIRIRQGTPVCEFKLRGHQWQIKMKNGETLVSPAVILTPPLPQSLALLHNSNLQLPHSENRELNGIHYDTCIAVLALLEGPSQLPVRGALEPASGPIQWIADNYMKGVSARQGALTIHGSHEFSREFWNRDPLEAATHLIEAASNWVSAKVHRFQTHKWRYARPVKVFHQICLSVDASAPLILAGDAFGGPRVEAAALSGLAAAKTLLYGTHVSPDLVKQELTGGEE